MATIIASSPAPSPVARPSLARRARCRPSPISATTPRLLVVVGDEHGARGEDAGLAALRQRLEVRVDHRSSGISASGRSGRTAGRGCGATARPSPAAPARRARPLRERGLPPRFTRPGFAGYAGPPPRQRPTGPGIAQHLKMLVTKRPALGAVVDRTPRTRGRGCPRRPRPPPVRPRTSDRAPRSPRPPEFCSSRGRVTIAIPAIRVVWVATWARNTNRAGRPPSSSRK